MSNPNDDGPTCPVCGEFMVAPWPPGPMFCELCEGEREAREAAIAEQESREAAPATPAVCSTCNGLGAVDESLGGSPTSGWVNCPDCADPPYLPRSAPAKPEEDRRDDARAAAEAMRALRERIAQSVETGFPGSRNGKAIAAEIREFPLPDLPPAKPDAWDEAMKTVREALQIIAGQKQCLDNLMSHAEVACVALSVLDAAMSKTPAKPDALEPK